jgi:hypothetical protein
LDPDDLPGEIDRFLGYATARPHIVHAPRRRQSRPYRAERVR